MISIRRGLACVSWVAAALSFSGLVHAQETLTDDFERPDGPVDGWTVSQGNWSIAGGRMTTTSAGAAASHIWLGAPPVVATGDLELTAKVSFGPPTADGVGRHGGFIFCASEASRRDAPAQTGYTVDWIDRTTELGLRLHRVDPRAGSAAFIPLSVGASGLTEVPETWTVQFDGDVIRVLGDGVPVIEATDGTYREGLIGAWAHTNNTTLFVDDLELTYFPKVLETCLTASAPVGPAPLSVDFDATCTQSLHGIEAYDWDFGDGDVGTGATTTHEFVSGGSYMVTLTVRDTQGNPGTATTTIEVYDSSPSFHDDFERADGPVDGWTVYQGDWQIASGLLTASVPTGPDEAWAWAGDPPYSFPANFTLSFTLNFAVRPPGDVGRHGGVMFCAARPTRRWDPDSHGYEISWIDRTAPPYNDHGVRLLRWDGQSFETLDIGARDPLLYPDPPLSWQIVVEGPAIRVFGDGDLLLETEDSTYRRGLFGIWGYPNGQVLEFDDMDVDSPALSPCFEVAPSASVRLGTEMAFDAGCSSATGTPIETWAWDFGDGTSASGKTATHTYATAGVRNVTLTITTEGGLSSSTERTVEAFAPIDTFADGFERADGPPAGWTVVGGDWAIRGGALEISIAEGVETAPEASIFAGDPPARFEGIASIEFDMEFLVDQPEDPLAVGRHAGAILFAESPNPRGAARNDGYVVDWLDNAAGFHGGRLYAVRDGVGGPHLIEALDAEPGRTWRVELDGDTIRLLVDGALKGEVLDPSFRFGHFGFWAYPGNPAIGFVQQVRFDNLAISAGGDERPKFHRGDANDDGGVNITDGIYILNFLFLGGETPTCSEAANVNDDDAINITDGIYVLNFLFLGGDAPAPPGPVEEPCGPDPEGSPGDLGCEGYTSC